MKWPGLEPFVLHLCNWHLSLEGAAHPPQTAAEVQAATSIDAKPVKLGLSTPPQPTSVEVGSFSIRQFQGTLIDFLGGQFFSNLTAAPPC